MKWHNRSGLGLMELLIALALLAAIAGALATSTNFGAKMLNKTQSLSDDSAEIALRLRLRAWVISATPPTLLTRYPTIFVGGVDSFTFTTLAPAPFAPDSAALRISVTATDGILSMQIDELDDEGNVMNTHQRTLATNINSAVMSYYATDPDAPGWSRSWSDTARLPSLIRITAAPGSVPEWPEFTVSPVLAQRGY